MTLTEIARSYLGERVNEHGRVVYSPSATFRKGPLYLMGHNPRGTGGDNDIKISADLDEQETKKGNNYIAADWGPGAGQSKLQKSIGKLFENSLVPLKDVFTTNLIFFSSHTAGDSGYEKEATYCWEVHKKFLRVVDPEILIVFGNSGPSPFSFIWETYRTSLTDWKTYSAKHGDWEIKSFNAIIEDRKRLVFGVPHLSRYMAHPESEGIQELWKAVSKLTSKASTATLPER
ncbi:MAG TPA: hypothetical protein VK737_09880 [Opitutales bacterium]|nr:hypothetical protein [Opitutales bacterium]